MNDKLRAILCITFLAVVTGLNLEGQVLKGSISATVTDPQGAVVSNAQVRATNLSTTAVLATKSDSAGLFRFNLIPAGSYKVEVSAQGFKTAIQNDIQVTAGADSGLGEIRLAVGEASATVEVTSTAPLVEASEAQVTNTFSGTTLQTFAGVQENQGLDNLALFVPGVNAARDAGFSNNNGGGGFSANGMRGRNNDQQIDGQNNNDNSVGGPSLFVGNPEFVNQYVLVTNQFGPEYGRNAGSVVNIITKSGTNSVHGSIFASENNSILNSLTNAEKNPQICLTNCLTQPPRINDEFGGFTVGGPLVKNKAFFFGGFDQEIFSGSTVLQNGALTPTPAGLAALAACFPTGIESQAVAAVSKFGPFGISGGNPTLSGAPVAGIVAACPTATFAGVTRTLATPLHRFDWIAKTDLQFGNDTVTARYLFNRIDAFNTDAFGTGAAGYPADVLDLNQQILMSWTHNFGTYMVNEARVGFGRLNTEFGGNSLGNTTPKDGQIDQALTNVTFNSATTNLPFGPSTAAPQGRIVNTWQAQDNWSYVLGRHQLKAGVNWTYQRSPNIFLPNLNGSFRFTDWNAYFANTPNRIRIANGPSQLDFREYDTFFYGGDDWKIGRDLTLQLGLTWSYYGQPENLFHDISTVRESNPSTAFWSSVVPAGELNAGSTLSLASRTNPEIPAPKNSFGPSVGFAYSPQWGGFITGHGKTVIRGGYRMLYDPPFYNIYLNISTSAPFVFLQTLTGASATGNPLLANPTGPNVRAQLAPSLTPGAFDPRTFAQTATTPNFGPDKVDTWSLGFERELTKSSAIEARYAGNHAYNLFQTLDGNPFIGDLKTDFPNLVPAGLTPCPAGQAFAPVAIGRVNCNQGIERTRSNTGYSNYNALQLEYRANNLFKQLTVRSAYTFSKTMDNVSEIFSTFGGGNSIFAAQNPANQVKGSGEYSFSGLDIPHQWSILFTEQLPFFKEQHGLLGHILGGWALSGNYILASGQRYTPLQIADALAGAAGNYYDLGYIAGFVGSDTARPFLSAPATAVGAFCGDELSTAACTAAFGPSGVTQLINLTTLQGPGGALAAATKDQVRFIVNGGVAQSVFGTPFGNMPRNPVQDAMTNLASTSIIKSFKINERASFEFHATLINVFNHPNFQSVDPFVDDAGLSGNGLGVGFGDPRVTDSTAPVLSSFPGTRRITFYGAFRF
ncbi:MAG TPA: carboxypeptidase-like regulatory domain-containing protein [Candidatus Angelobacter sp.]